MLTPKQAKMYSYLLTWYATYEKFPAGYERQSLEAMEALDDALLDYCGEVIIEEAVNRYESDIQSYRMKVANQLHMTETDREWLKSFNNL